MVGVERVFGKFQTMHFGDKEEEQRRCMDLGIPQTKEKKVTWMDIMKFGLLLKK